MYWSTSSLYTDNPTSSSSTVTWGGLIQKGKKLLFRDMIAGTTRKSGSVAVFWGDVLSTDEQNKRELLSFLWDY